MRGGMHVRTAIGPACEQRTVLLEKDAVLNERERQKEVGQAARFRSMLGYLHSALPPLSGRLGGLTVESTLGRIVGAVADVP